MSEPLILRYDIQDNGTVKIKRINADLLGLGRGLDTASAKSKKMDLALGGLGRGLGFLKSQLMSVQGLIVGTFGVMGMGRAIGAIASYEKAMSGVQAVTLATAEDMAKMQERARDLGATTEHTATDAANAFRFLGMAGFSASESLAAISATLDLATAGELDLARTADIASNILSGFNMRATEAQRVMDVMAVSASNSNTNIEQLGDAMSYLAPAAAAVGVSIEDAAAAVGVLSNAGIQASRAGTSMRMILSRLVDPTTEGAAAVEKLGLKLAELDPRAHSLIDIFTRLRDAQMGLEEANALFGERQGAAAIAIAGAIPKLIELTGKTHDAEGALAQMAKTMRDNLSTDIATTKSAFQELILTVGDEGVKAALREILQSTTEMLREMTKGNALVTFARSLAAFFKAAAASLNLLVVAGKAFIALAIARVLAGITSALAAGITSMIAFSSRLTSLRIQMAATGTAARGLSLAMKTLGGPAGLIFIAAEALVYFGSKAMFARQMTEGLTEETDTLYESLKAMADAGPVDQAEKKLSAMRAELKALLAEPTGIPSGIRPMTLSGDGESRTLQTIKDEAGIRKKIDEDQQKRIRQLTEDIKKYGDRLAEIKKKEEDWRKEQDQQQQNNVVGGNEATGASALLAMLNGQLAISKAHYETIATANQSAEAIDRKRVDLTRQLAFEGEKIDPLSKLEAIERSYARKREEIAAQMDSLKAERALEAARSVEESDLSRIADLTSQIANLEKTRAGLPVLEQLDKQLERQKEALELERQQQEEARKRLEIQRDIAQAQRDQIGIMQDAVYGMEGPFTPLGLIPGGFMQSGWEWENNQSMFGHLKGQLQQQLALYDEFAQLSIEQKARQQELEDAMTRVHAANQVAAYTNMFGAIKTAMANFNQAIGSESRASLIAQKAIASAMAVMQAYQAAQAAYTSSLLYAQSGGPAAIMSAAGMYKLVLGIGLANAAMIAATPIKMHSGGLVTTDDRLGSDEVNRTLQTGEYVVSRRGVETLDRINRGDVSGGQAAPVIDLSIYNVVQGEDAMLAAMASDSGRNVIVNTITYDNEQAGPIRRMIKGGG